MQTQRSSRSHTSAPRDPRESRFIASRPCTLSCIEQVLVCSILLVLWGLSGSQSRTSSCTCKGPNPCRPCCSAFQVASASTSLHVDTIAELLRRTKRLCAVYDPPIQPIRNWTNASESRILRCIFAVRAVWANDSIDKTHKRVLRSPFQNENE